MTRPCVTASSALPAVRSPPSTYQAQAVARALSPVACPAAGTVAGYYTDTNDVDHGFLRDHRGSITTFDYPRSTNTVAYNINLEGTVAGFYLDKNGVRHGYLREANGRFTSFDPPSGTFETLQCAATCLNPEGALVGIYMDETGCTTVSCAPLR